MGNFSGVGQDPCKSFEDGEMPMGQRLLSGFGGLLLFYMFFYIMCQTVPPSASLVVFFPP